MTSSYLAVYAISLPTYAVYMYLQKVASSMRRMMLCAFANATAAVVQVVTLLVFTPVVGLNFVAFSSTLFFVTLCVVMFASLHRALGHIGLGGLFASALRALALGLAGALVGALTLHLLNTLVGDCMGSLLRSAAYCVLAGIPALVVTYGGGMLLHVPEAEMIRRLARRVVRR